MIWSFLFNVMFYVSMLFVFVVRKVNSFPRVYRQGLTKLYSKSNVSCNSQLAVRILYCICIQRMCSTTYYLLPQTILF